MGGEHKSGPGKRIFCTSCSQNFARMTVTCFTLRSARQAQVWSNSPKTEGRKPEISSSRRCEVCPHAGWVAGDSFMLG